jgi:hypothetical protein
VLYALVIADVYTISDYEQSVDPNNVNDVETELAALDIKTV